MLMLVWFIVLIIFVRFVVMVVFVMFGVGFFLGLVVFGDLVEDVFVVGLGWKWYDFGCVEV